MIDKNLGMRITAQGIDDLEIEPPSAEVEADQKFGDKYRNTKQARRWLEERIGSEDSYSPVED